MSGKCLYCEKPRDRLYAGKKVKYYQVCKKCHELEQLERTKCYRCENHGIVKDSSLCNECFILDAKRKSASSYIKSDLFEYSKYFVEVTYKINYKFTNIKTDTDLYNHDIHTSKIDTKMYLLFKEFECKLGEDIQITDEFKKIYDIKPNGIEPQIEVYMCGGYYDDLINCDITSEIISAKQTF
jgi:hypothetical protein